MASLATSGPVFGETRRALLIGIDNYVPQSALRARTRSADPAASGSRGVWTDLEGAVNDVEAMRVVLVTRFGFKREDVHTLQNGEATRAAILGGVRRWLIDPAVEGDVSFFYYAGHGSQVRNSRSREPDKMDESLVPADSNAGRPDIRDKELTALLNQALDKHVFLTVALDSCHSGSMSRGQIGSIRVRSLPADVRDVADPSSPPSLESRGALVIAAAQSHQVAAETIDEGGTPHGLFTWALVKTLRTMPVDQRADRAFLSLRAMMQSTNVGQEPDLSATPDRRGQPLFGAHADSVTGATIVAAESKATDGTVVLQAGIAAGLGKDCELRAIGSKGAQPTIVRVVQVEGMTRSQAVVISGDAAAITAGTLFEVTRWAAQDLPTLRVFLETAQDLGAPLRLGQGSENDAVEVARDREKADYILIARRVGDTAEYAWSRPFPDVTIKSPLPTRTRWIAVDPSRPAAAARELEQQALRLGVIRAWLQLESPPNVDAFPYHLALQNATTSELVTTGPTHEGEEFGLVLVDDAALHQTYIAPRYVYVFAIDSAGASTLLFPSADAGGGGENRFPVRDDDATAWPGRIQLGSRMLFSVTAPFGVDTYLMLSTATPLADPMVLQGEAIRSRSAGRGASDALTQLLSTVGVAARGARPSTSTDWTIERLTIESVAK